MGKTASERTLRVAGDIIVIGVHIIDHYHRASRAASTQKPGLE